MGVRLIFQVPDLTRTEIHFSVWQKAVLDWKTEYVMEQSKRDGFDIPFRKFVLKQVDQSVLYVVRNQLFRHPAVV